MRHHTLIVAAASLAVSAFAVPSFAADARVNVDMGNDAPAHQSADMNNSATTRPADKLSNEQRANIMNTLGDITQAALSQNGVKDAVGYFAKEDADRIGDVKQRDDLNNAIAQFQKDWQDKYGQAFELKHDSKVFQDASFRLTPGSDLRARQAGERMGPSDQNNPNSEKMNDEKMNNDQGDQKVEANRPGDRSQPIVVTHTGADLNAGNAHDNVRANANAPANGEKTASANVQADTNGVSASARTDNGKAGTADATAGNTDVTNGGNDIASRSSDNPAINASTDLKANGNGASANASDKSTVARPHTEMARTERHEDMSSRDRNARDINSDEAIPAAGNMHANSDAYVTIAAGHGLPETTVNLVKQRHWVVDVSNSLTADSLQTNLLHAVQKMDQDKANWPDNVSDGYRMAAHQVFMALEDRNMQ